MANEENLKKGAPYRFKTGEKQVEIARKGGIASGEARRRKKTMRETAQMLLDMQIPDAAKELKLKLKLMGLTEDDYTYQSAVMVGIINQAMKGNTRAAEFLRDTVGDNPFAELKEKELEIEREKLEGDTKGNDLVQAWVEGVLKSRGDGQNGK